MKYLYKKLEESRGAYIENLIFMPNEYILDKNSEAFKEFRNLEPQEICKVFNWREEQDVFEMFKDENDELVLSSLMYLHDKFGFLAECYFPQISNIIFNDKGEPSLWMTNGGICTIHWIYGETIGELIHKIEEKSDTYFDSVVEEYRGK